MARTVADCAVLLAAMAGPDFSDATTTFGACPPPLTTVWGARPLGGVRLALSPRPQTLDVDVGAGLDRAVGACAELGATIVDRPTRRQPRSLDHLSLMCAEMLRFHRRFDGERDRYRPSTRDFIERGEREALTAQDYFGSPRIAVT